MRKEIEVLLFKLTDGGRVLRFSDALSGLALEKRLDPKLPVQKQKQRLGVLFEELLRQESGESL